MRRIVALAVGMVIGVGLVVAVEAIPWRWLQVTTLGALIVAILVWNVRELRWLHRQRREMAMEHAPRDDEGGR